MSQRRSSAATRRARFRSGVTSAAVCVSSWSDSRKPSDDLPLPLLQHNRSARSRRVHSGNLRQLPPRIGRHRRAHDLRHQTTAQADSLDRFSVVLQRPISDIMSRDFHSFSSRAYRIVDAFDRRGCRCGIVVHQCIERRQDHGSVRQARHATQQFCDGGDTACRPGGNDAPVGRGGFPGLDLSLKKKISPLSGIETPFCGQCFGPPVVIMSSSSVFCQCSA